jgi:hypothetical protein
MAARLPDAIQRLRRHLDRVLFVQAAVKPSRLGSAELAILLAGLLALAVTLQLLRIGPGIALDSLWAEDGPVFLQGAIQHGFWTDLWTTYAGYLVFVPRLIGAVAHLFPLRDAAAAISIVSVLLVALSGLVVWVASAAHVRSPYLRGTLVALVVLAPTAALESIASGTYVCWYMLVAVFWLLLWRPRTTRGAGLGGGFILLTALSTPGTWFFLPLTALRALAIRDRRDGILVGAWALGSAIQIPAYLLQDEKQVDPLWSHDIFTAYLQRVLDGAALGERLGGNAWELLGWGLLIALVVLAAIGLYLGLRRAGPAARWLALLTVPISAVMFGVAVYQRGVGPQVVWLDGTHTGAGGRYAIVPALLLVGLALVLVEATCRRRPELFRWLAGATAALLIAGVTASFDVRDSAVRGTPAWGDSIDAGADQCRAEGASVVTIPTSPPGTRMVVTCDETAP